MAVLDDGGATTQSSIPTTRGAVPRPRVFDALDARAEAGGVALVCGPAGYGKSMAVADWLNTRDRSPVVWVDLRGIGSDTGELWSAISSAAHAVAGDRGDGWMLARTATSALAPAVDAPAELAAWFADWGDGPIIVLDDVHEITGARSNTQLHRFCERLPDNATLILITRHDPPWPLHRMRLAESLSEIRADVLRFDVDEALALIAATAPVVDRAMATLLVERTQGWAAGLRLSALTLRSADDPRRCCEELSGRSGYIADYLMREVFLSLPQRWQLFLTRICVVDEVCPELATALGCADSVDTLAELTHLNIFVSEAVNRPGTYRVHPLLLDLLRSRITDRRDLAVAHRRASRWFREQGRPMDALEHALAAHEWEAAAELVGTHVLSWTMSRPPDHLIDVLRRVPREQLLIHPGLAIGMATAVGMTGSTDGLDELIDAARRRICLIEGRRRRRYEFLLDLVEFGLRRWLGGVDELLGVYRRLCHDPDILAGLGLADWDLIRRVLVGNVGTCELWHGERDVAREHLMQAASDDGDARILLPVLSARANLAYLEWEDGELAEARRLATRTVEDLAELGLPQAVQGAAAYLALAGVALDRDELDESGKWLDAAERAAREPHVIVVVVILRAKLMMARRAGAAAMAAAERAVDLARLADVPAIVARAAVSAQEALAAGRPIGGFVTGTDIGTTVRGRVLQCVQEAIDDSGGRTRSQRSDALELALGDAVDLQFRSPFLDRGRALQELLSDHVLNGARGSEFALELLNRMPTERIHLMGDDGRVVAPLSGREMDVLRQLLTSRTVAEIADDLFISVNTVKTHQRAIYQKLGVRGRRAAIARARELHLV